MIRYDEPTQLPLVHVCTAARDKGNWCWDIKNENAISFNEWFNLTLKQAKNDEGKYIYSISMNGEELRSWENTTPETFENVDGLLGNTYEPEFNYVIPVAQYRNFKFTTTETDNETDNENDIVVDKDVIQKNMVLYQDITVHPTYEVSVDLNLEEYTNTRWANIFGFRQQGADVLEAGYRMPSGKFSS